MTDLLAELRRSPDEGDARVAALLAALRPGPSARPRASEQLAAFLAARAIDTVPLPTGSAADVEPELVVVIGSPADAPARRWRTALAAVVPGGLVAKLALTAAAAVAAVAVAVTGGPSTQVVVTPSDRPTGVPRGSAPRSDDAEPTPRAAPAPAGSGDAGRPTHRTAPTSTGPTGAAPRHAATVGAGSPPDGPGDRAEHHTGDHDGDDGGRGDEGGSDGAGTATTSSGAGTPSGDDSGDDSGDHSRAADSSGSGGSGSTDDGSDGSDDAGAED